MWPDPEAASRGSFTDCVALTHWPFSTRTRGVAPETPDRISFGDRRPEVRLVGSGDSLRAWIYWYRGSIDGADPIPSGEYLGL